MAQHNAPVDIAQLSRDAVQALAITPRAHALVRNQLGEVFNPPEAGTAVWTPDGSPKANVAQGWASVPGRRLEGAVKAAEAIVQQERDLAAQKSSVNHELPNARVRGRVVPGLTS